MHLTAKKQSLFFDVISGSFLIAGTAIGAGMLGFPLITGMAGFIPALIVTIATWIYMLLTGFFLLEISLWMPKGSNILSMAHHCLGTTGKFIAGGMYLFLYYCIMIAYFAAGSPLLGNFIEKIFHISLGHLEANLIFGVIFGIIVAIGPHWINGANIVLMVAMIITWIALLGVGADEVKVSNLEIGNFPKAFFAIPILFSAFGYHNIVPPLCTFLDKRKKALKLSLIIGTAIPLIVYILWQWLIMGVVSKESLLKAFEAGEPVTGALEEVIGKPWIPLMGYYFAFFAIVTSVLGVSFSLVDFLGDGFHIKRKGWPRIGLTLMTFFPPFLCSSISPSIFDVALGIAGGFGEAFLNGLLPIFLVWIARYVYKEKAEKLILGEKRFLSFLIVLGFFVMVLEVYNLIFLH